MCAARGIIRAATVPDHIIPLHKGGTDDDANVQCLCDPCHLDKTNKDMGHNTAQPIDINGRPTDPLHPWNIKP
jgi:5-methylcytosine-specific restriction protein A